MSSTQASKILTRLKGLRQHLQADEEPCLALPAIWDGGGKQAQGETCDVIITNQRLIGFYARSFPREKLFFEALPLSHITNVTLRQKSYEPVFRELIVTEGKRKVYIRAPRRKAEEIYEALQTVNNAPSAQEESSTATSRTGEDEEAQASGDQKPAYGRQQIRVPFESSSLAILILFIGGILLELVGLIVWSATDANTGIPLCLAGLVAVGSAIFLQRQRRKGK